MLAIAAGLWFLYLLPNWRRRREFLATERNATRLQRAIRVMAEAAEAPDELQLEANAREAVRQERLLAQERRRAEALSRAEVRAAAVRARAAEAHAAELERAARRPVPAAIVARGADAALAAVTIARLRRTRRMSGVLLLLAVAVAAVQIWLMVSTGAVVGSWLVLAGSALVVGVALRLQARAAARIRSLSRPEAAPVPRRRTTQPLIDVELPEAAPTREWTPVPVPKPLYIERGEAPRVPVVPPVSAEQLLRAAQAEAEQALAAAHDEPEVVRFPTRETRPDTSVAPAPSRFASMGIIDDVDAASPDLDEVLRRRRSG